MHIYVFQMKTYATLGKSRYGNFTWWMSPRVLYVYWCPWYGDKGIIVVYQWSNPQWYGENDPYMTTKTQQSTNPMRWYIPMGLSTTKQNK